MREKLHKVATNRLTLISLALLVSGLFLIHLSYSYTDVVITPNVGNYQVPVSSNSTASVLIYQHYNLSENIVFSMVPGKQVNYTLYKYYVYTNTQGTVVHQLSYFKQGVASNSTVLHLSRMYLPQGQSYYIKMTSSSSTPFTVGVQTVQNVTYVQHSARNLGAPGLAIVMGSAVFMAFAITRELDIGDIKSTNI